MAKDTWAPAKRKYGIVVSNFSSAVLHSINLVIGETVQILEDYSPDGTTVTWHRGCTLCNKNKKGIFPAAYVVTKECTVENEGPFEVVTPVEDAIIKELTFVLREWNVRWKSLFVERSSVLDMIRLVMEDLLKHRSTLVSDTLTNDQALELKQQVVTMIDWGNGKLGMDLVPRVRYQQVDPDKVSVVEMFRIHEKSVKNCQGAMPGGMLKVKSREIQGELMHHLLVGLCSFACSVGDNAEVQLSLYDPQRNSFISEKYVMYLTKEGRGEGNDKSNNTIFTDLSSEDISGDIYLVLHIFRKGRLTTEGSVKKVPLYTYRRPWGVSVLHLRDLFQINPENELEYFLRVQCVENESFYNMHDWLIKKQMQMTTKAAMQDKNQGVTLSVKILHGDLKTVKVENPILFNKGIVLTQRMGFPEIINPGEIRNDLYLTLSGADFDRGSKTAPKNIEVRVTVHNEQYQPIKECILSANGDPMISEFYSYVLYHCNAPKWNETIRLSIPIEKFNTAHIRLELCHCSNRDKVEKKLYGFAFLPVTTDEITRQDGTYNLCIYKCEDAAKIKNYLKFPPLKEDFTDPEKMRTIPDHLPYQHSNKECVTVQTFLCSSKFAQQADILNVLQWSSKPVTSIPNSLENIMKPSRGQELIRYLQDILDALFNMFRSGSQEKHPYAVNIFNALVFIFNLLHEEKFEKFSVVLEDYLENSFSSTLAHRELMFCLKELAEKAYTCTDFEEKPTEAIKSLADIFKFAVKSCMLSKRVLGSQLIGEFRASLNSVFEAFSKILQGQEKELHATQALLLTNLHQTYIPLLHIMTNVDLAQLIVYILSKIRKDPGKLVLRAKTKLIKNTLNSDTLMLDPKSRGMLLPLCIRHLKTCLLAQKHLDLTASTLGDLLARIYNLKETCDVKEEVTRIIQGVFDATVRTLWTITDEQRASAGSLLVACLTEMLRLMDVDHYQKLMSEYPKPKQLKVRFSAVVLPQQSTASMKDFLNRVLLVFRNLIHSNDFPADWTTMKMITNNVMLTAIQYIAEDLTNNFLHGSDFDRELWNNFFLLAVDFITQPALQLENYSEAKSSQIKDKYNDMRVPVGFHICSLWSDLGQNKQHLMMDMIGPFLKVTMVPELDLRKATIPIFFDIMQCDFQLNGHLRKVEGKIIHECDSLVIEHNGDADYKELFSSILLDKVQAEPELQEEGKRFVFSVTDLLTRLLDYREIMDGEEQRDTKMHCTFNILNFYKDSRRDMYIRYISRLYELHYSASNFVEAGLTLRLYAQLLNWSTAMLPAEMSYASQTEAERKEELFNRILNCFDKGKAWEYGIPLCKELAEHYEKTFQYKKLGGILQRQATFLYQILEGYRLRQDPTYYRVSYFGNTFPPYLKNKSFIYRGDECLKLTTIMEQLRAEYPSATLLTQNSQKDESFKQGDAQYIQIVNVKAMPAERPEFLGKEVPNEVSSFYKSNEVDTFQFDLPYHRSQKDPDNEFKTLCLERTVLQSSYKLPGILRWYEVTSTKVVHLCPVQAAICNVEQMNVVLKSSINDAISNSDLNLQNLLMRVQGSINSVVNGGIHKYKQAFFDDEYASKFPKEAQYIGDLRLVITELLQISEKALAVVGKYASPEMRPLHRELIDIFEKVKVTMGYQSTQTQNKHRSSSISIGSSQRPSTPSSNSMNSSGSNRSSVISGEITYGEDDHYVETPDENLFFSPAPPCPDKRRGQSLRVASLTNLTQKQSGSSRPLSAIIPSSNHIQIPLPTYQEHPVSVINMPPADNAPAPKISRKQSLPENNYLASQPTPPPVPGRKQIVSVAAGDRAPPLPVSRSESNKSTDSSAPPRPPRLTIPSPTTQASPSGRQDAPPLPKQRNTLSPLNNNNLDSSVTSPTPSEYNNFKGSGPSPNTSNLNGSRPPIPTPSPSRDRSLPGTSPLNRESRPPTLTKPAREPPPTPPSHVTSAATPPPPLPSHLTSAATPPPPVAAKPAPKTPVPNGPPPIPQRKPSTSNTHL